jgi:hypothetical protein
MMINTHWRASQQRNSSWRDDYIGKLPHQYSCLLWALVHEAVAGGRLYGGKSVKQNDIHC